jgi:peptidoglycan/xylan/chitin deacetylase (PgdA/CDA1 family)
MIHARMPARARKVVLPAVALLGVLLGMHPAVAAARPTACPDVTATGGAFVAEHIGATGMRCNSVRAKLANWTRQGPAAVRRNAHGWRCRRLAGAGARWTCTQPGGRSSMTFTVSRERVAPRISIASPGQGARYAVGAVISAAYHCSDRAGIAACGGTVVNGAALPTSQPGTGTFTVTARDRSGNRAERTVTYSVVSPATPPTPSEPSAPSPPRDTTAPTIEFTSPTADSTYKLDSTVRAEYSCRDDVAIQSCEGTVANGAPVPTDTIGAHTVSVTARDIAGNTTTNRVTYKVGDRNNPTVSITSPVAGASFAWGQAAIAHYTCADDDRVASCSATVAGQPVADGANLPTTGAPGPGTRALEVKATDASGNVSTAQVSYTVNPAGYYALTYDDGPNGDYTQGVLDALHSVNAKATFFVVGSAVTDFPGLTQAIVAGGHYVENHTMTHTNLGPTDPSDPTTPAHGFNAAGQAKDPTAEVRDANALIASKTGGVAPAFLRPPYGLYDQSTIDLAKTFGLTVVTWTTETNDYTGIAPSQIVANALAVPLGGIILMHDSNANTVAATPTIVTRLKIERGMLPGKLGPSSTAHFITGWEGNGPFFAEAVAP